MAHLRNYQLQHMSCMLRREATTASTLTIRRVLGCCTAISPRTIHDEDVTAQLLPQHELGSLPAAQQRAQQVSLDYRSNGLGLVV
jgi:hypothetical protein